jgi:hypothetical protein
VCNLQLQGDLWDRGRAYEATTESACWWWPHRDFVIVSERPIAIHRELRNPRITRGWNSHRLHAATGPAVSFPDGWALYYWHGVRVSQDIIEAPDAITSQAVLQESNAEVRRVMVERMGLDRFLSQAKAKVLHTDQGGKRILHRIDWENDEPIVAVQVQCPTTGQIYFLRVPPQIDRCDKAVAWTFGFDKVRDYQPAIET